MGDGDQKQQAQPLSVADARGELEEQVLVVQVAPGRRIGEERVTADHEDERVAGVVGQAQSLDRGQG